MTPTPPMPSSLGHGETLASGAVRYAWRMSMNRLVPGEAQLTAISSFGAALAPDRGPGTPSQPVNCGALALRMTARSALAIDWFARVDSSRRVWASWTVPQALPQDIEGCLTDDGQVGGAGATPTATR